MLRGPWACLGVSLDFRTLVGRARAVPRAWTFQEQARPGTPEARPGQSLYKICAEKHISPIYRAASRSPLTIVCPVTLQRLIVRVLLGDDKAIKETVKYIENTGHFRLQQG